jgi:hypothetical protein
MFRSTNRRVTIGVWFGLLVAVAGVGLLSGVPFTMRSGAFWFFVCSVPPAVMLMVWRGAPPPTVAEVIYAVDQKAWPCGIDTMDGEEARMSRRNGDRARFQKERKRRMLRRQRIQELIKSIRPQPLAVVEPADVKAEWRSREIDRAGAGISRLAGRLPVLSVGKDPGGEREGGLVRLLAVRGVRADVECGTTQGESSPAVWRALE